jgi:hypothetical protein
MSDSAPDVKRSPTDTLLSCLEDFGESEPKRVLVIHTNTAGELVCQTSSPYSMVEILGMLEFAKTIIVSRFSKSS